MTTATSLSSSDDKDVDDENVDKDDRAYGNLVMFPVWRMMG
jgi:hypothetical protein